MKLRVAIGPSSFAEEDATPARMLETAGVEIIPNPFSRRLNEAEIIAHLKDADGLIAGLEPLNRRVLGAAPRLKALARVGIGVANVDFEAAAERGIKVSSTPDAPAEAVAEMTVAALLALSRRLLESNAALHAGEWKKFIGRGLAGMRVLIVGYGRIGRRVAELLRPFGAEILAADPFLPAGAETPGARPVTLEEGLAEADAVSLHASGAEVILGEAQFALMRTGALVLNSARGELVDESALVRALEAGKIAGAWFDAFWEEPYRGPLLRFAQVLLTPHAATYTGRCRLEMETQAVRNLLRDLGLAEA